MAVILIRAISWFAEILIMMLFIRCILSWFAQSPTSPLFNAYGILVQLTEPFVAPCRKLLSGFNTGMFDFSVLLAFFLIEFVERVLIVIINMLLG